MESDQDFEPVPAQKTPDVALRINLWISQVRHNNKMQGFSLDAEIVEILIRQSFTANVADLGQVRPLPQPVA